MTKKLVHVLKGRVVEFNEPVTRARAIHSEGLTRVKKVKLPGLHHAVLDGELRVPLIDTQPKQVKEILEVRMRH